MQRGMGPMPANGGRIHSHARPPLWPWQSWPDPSSPPSAPLMQVRYASLSGNKWDEARVVFLGYNATILNVESFSLEAHDTDDEGLDSGERCWTLASGGQSDGNGTQLAMVCEWI